MLHSLFRLRSALLKRSKVKALLDAGPHVSSVLIITAVIALIQLLSQLLHASTFRLRSARAPQVQRDPDNNLEGSCNNFLFVEDGEMRMV